MWSCYRSFRFLEPRRCREEAPLYLAFDLVGEFSVVEIPGDLAFGLSPTGKHHRVGKPTKKPETISPPSFRNKVACSDGGWDVSHGSSPFNWVRRLRAFPVSYC